MATPINNIDIIDDQIHIYVDTASLPDTYYVNQQWLQHLKYGYEDNILCLFAFVHKERTLPISFAAKDYCDLAEHLKEHLTYTLAQARIIIRWIEDNVAYTGDDCDWGAAYLEILENAIC